MSFKIEINNQTKNKIDLTELNEIIKNFLKAYKIKNKEVSLALVNDQAIKKINKAYLGRNQATDVLAFPGSSNELGEIIIDYDQIKRQAGSYHNTVGQELIFVLVHGLLHLVGYDDKTEKQRKKMERLGEEFIKKNLQ